MTTLIIALIFFLIASGIVIVLAAAVQSGRISEYERQHEERERHERIGRGFGEAEITQLRRVDGEKKWKARVGK